MNSVTSDVSPQNTVIVLLSAAAKKLGSYVLFGLLASVWLGFYTWYSWSWPLAAVIGLAIFFAVFLLLPVIAYSTLNSLSDIPDDLAEMSDDSKKSLNHLKQSATGKGGKTKSLFSLLALAYNSKELLADYAGLGFLLNPFIAFLLFISLLTLGLFSVLAAVTVITFIF